MWVDLLKRFTKLGDPVLLLLGAFAVFFYLWCDDERRAMARAWAAAFALCVLLTVASKLLFHLVRWNDTGAFRLLSPSGHAAIGTGFYGCCAIMLTAGRGPAIRAAVWTGTAILLGLLAASRVLLGLHSVPEMLVAFAIGAAAIAAFVAQRSGGRTVRLDAGPLISLLSLIFAAYFIRHIDGESLIVRVMQRLRQ